MARHRMTSDGPVPFTPAEEAAWDAQEIQAAQEHQALMQIAYQEKRRAEYPPIGDQLDAMWKGGDAAAAMLAQIQAVKAKYPKG